MNFFSIVCVASGSQAKGRTIRKLMGGAGEVQKKNSRKGKLNEKNFLQAN